MTDVSKSETISTKRQRIADRALRRLTGQASEIRAHLNTLLEQDGKKRVAARLFLLTGARYSEVARLAWPQWDRERRSLTLVGKTGTRTIPVGQELHREMLAWWIQAGQPKTGRAWSTSLLRDFDAMPAQPSSDLAPVLCRPGNTRQ